MLVLCCAYLSDPEANFSFRPYLVTMIFGSLYLAYLYCLRYLLIRIVVLKVPSKVLQLILLLFVM